MITNIIILLPAIIYLFIIYLSAISQSISIDKSIKYLLYGFLSPFIVIGLKTFVPFLNEYHFLDSNVPVQLDNGLFTYNPTMFGVFIMNFLQIGFIEEFSKFVIFWLTIKLFDKKDNNIIQTFFNVLLVSTGFAIIENITYYNRYNHIDIIFIRSITSLIAHMTFGMIMGYFIAIAKTPYMSRQKTNFSVWLYNNPIYKKNLFIGFGILCSSIVHGLYDYDLAMEYGHSSLILLSLIALSYFLFKKLKYRYKVLMRSTK